MRHYTLTRFLVIRPLFYPSFPCTALLLRSQWPFHILQEPFSSDKVRKGWEVIGAGGPPIPDNRAEWIVEVLRGYTAQQQMIMRMALVTTFRALLSELGWAMHVASMVSWTQKMTNPTMIQMKEGMGLVFYRWRQSVWCSTMHASLWSAAGYAEGAGGALTGPCQAQGPAHTKTASTTSFPCSAWRWAYT